MIVKDSMILIHLAKTSLLEYACIYFKEVLIPSQVHQEILAGKDKGYFDVEIILGMISKGLIKVVEVDSELLTKVKEFNLIGGEAEAVAIYWQKRARLLATDDDNVRKRSAFLKISIIGTPGIILRLFKEKFIEKYKVKESIFELRKIGWFSPFVLDKILLEAEK